MSASAFHKAQTVVCGTVAVAATATLGTPALTTAASAVSLATAWAEQRDDRLEKRLEERMNEKLQQMESKIRQMESNINQMESNNINKNVEQKLRKVNKSMDQKIRKNNKTQHDIKKAQAMGDRSWFDNQQVRVKNIVLKHFNTKKKSALRAALREIKEQKPGCGDVPCKVLMTLANLLHVKSITGKSTWKTKAEVVDDLLAVI